jgi:hypothetical protein
MPAKSKKAQKPEDMLIRVIRVAEILAKGQSQPLSSTTQSTDTGIDVSVIPAQKTQK